MRLSIGLKTFGLLEPFVGVFNSWINLRVYFVVYILHPEVSIMASVVARLRFRIREKSLAKESINAKREILQASPC